jgi:hypothetical protein
MWVVLAINGRASGVCNDITVGLVSATSIVSQRFETMFRSGIRTRGRP